MASRRLYGGVLFGLIMAGAANAQAPLPLVEDAAWGPLQANVERLIQGLDALNAPLPAEVTQSLKQHLQNGRTDASASGKIQQLLDTYCLIGININPESRVKAARGEAPAELTQGEWTVCLIKVQNDAGVTQQLQLYSPQLEETRKREVGRWLRARIITQPPMRQKLSGEHIEYLLMQLSSVETGKREATLIFDVGQGTQDLGFRAEVPILFTIK